MISTYPAVMRLYTIPSTSPVFSVYLKILEFRGSAHEIFRLEHLCLRVINFTKFRQHIYRRRYSKETAQESAYTSADGECLSDSIKIDSDIREIATKVGVNKDLVKRVSLNEC